ncbi:HAD family hydrolase [Actibacterium lipolyticum]|uniref:Phosphorylated carbohydrates phosphatase n=1 Tax=Actibacterium lipolyticum TaxID=1524263 RepID=A0A238JRN7_9RHOB|nr:HAD family phosphatase [Actibacterium lipolyticum]SMX33321.1 Phosphorylated carbohydrates phosphatase [Actibacterium lipolyticum]
MQSLPAAVIFDLDGCLVDSEPLCIRAIAREIQALGVGDISPEDIRARFLGVSMRVICDEVAKQTGKSCPDDFVERVESQLFVDYQNRLKQIDGAAVMLATLRKQGVKMAIATGGSVKRMTQTLTMGGLSQWFAGRAFSADQVANGKPAPDLFLLAADEIGVPPESCVVLEDSPHGIQGAVSAGMRAVGFVGGAHLEGIRDAHAEKLLGKGATTIAHDMTEVTHALLSAAPCSDD